MAPCNEDPVGRLEGPNSPCSYRVRKKTQCDEASETTESPTSTYDGSDDSGTCEFDCGVAGGDAVHGPVLDGPPAAGDPVNNLVFDGPVVAAAGSAEPHPADGAEPFEAATGSPVEEAGIFKATAPQVLSTATSEEGASDAVGIEEALAVAPAQEASSCGGANQEVPVAASGEKASVGGTVPEVPTAAAALSGEARSEAAVHGRKDIKKFLAKLNISVLRSLANKHDIEFSTKDSADRLAGKLARLPDVLTTAARLHQVGMVEDFHVTERLTLAQLEQALGTAEAENQRMLAKIGKMEERIQELEAAEAVSEQNGKGNANEPAEERSDADQSEVAKTDPPEATFSPARSLAECCPHVKEAWAAKKAPHFDIKMPRGYNHNDDNKGLLNRFRACAHVCNSANGTVGMKLHKAMARQQCVIAEPMVIEWNNAYMEAYQVVKEARALVEAVRASQNKMAAAAMEPYSEIVELAKKGKRASQKLVSSMKKRARQLPAQMVCRVDVSPTILAEQVPEQKTALKSALEDPALDSEGEGEV